MILRRAAISLITMEVKLVFESVAENFIKRMRRKIDANVLYIDCDRSRRSVKEISIDLKNLQKRPLKRKLFLRRERL